MYLRVRKVTSTRARRRRLQYPDSFEIRKQAFSEPVVDHEKRNRRSRRKRHRIRHYPSGPIPTFENSSRPQLRLPKFSVLPFTPEPVWEQPQNNYGSNRWVVYSLKLGRFVILYSDLERDHWVQVEADPSIVLFCEQPLRISVRLASGSVQTIFDMWLKWRDGHEELREVKYKDQLDDSPRVNRQLEAQLTWTNLVSFRYSVVTEDTIRANPIFLANWKRILCYLGPKSRSGMLHEMDQVQTLLANFGCMSIAELERRLSHLDCMLVRIALFRLMHSGSVRALALDTRNLDRLTIVQEVREDD